MTRAVTPWPHPWCQRRCWPRLPTPPRPWDRPTSPDGAPCIVRLSGAASLAGWWRVLTATQASRRRVPENHSVCAWASGRPWGAFCSALVVAPASPGASLVCTLHPGMEWLCHPQVIPYDDPGTQMLTGVVWHAQDFWSRQPRGMIKGHQLTLPRAVSRRPKAYMCQSEGGKRVLPHNGCRASCFQTNPAGSCAALGVVHCGCLARRSSATSSCAPSRASPTATPSARPTSSPTRATRCTTRWTPDVRPTHSRKPPSACMPPVASCSHLFMPDCQRVRPLPSLPLTSDDFGGEHSPAPGGYEAVT